MFRLALCPYVFRLVHRQVVGWSLCLQSGSSPGHGQFSPLVGSQLGWPLVSLGSQVDLASWSQVRLSRDGPLVPSQVSTQLGWSGLQVTWSSGPQLRLSLARLVCIQVCLYVLVRVHIQGGPQLGQSILRFVPKSLCSSYHFINMLVPSKVRSVLIQF